MPVIILYEIMVDSNSRGATIEKFGHDSAAVIAFDQISFYRDILDSAIKTR